MQGALVILRPLIAETGAKPIGKYVIGTVKGDIHDIGKNLVIIMLEGAGFEVVDLGVNCPPEKFVEAVRTNEPHIVGFSAFLTTTMPMFKVNIQALEKAGLRDKVTVMVGGAPVTEEYAKLAGADHYAPDASFATRMAKKIVGAAQAAENAALTQAADQVERLVGRDPARDDEQDLACGDLGVDRFRRPCAGLGHRRVGGAFGQQEADFLLHRAAVRGRTQPQPLFDGLVDITDGERAHDARIADDCIAINAIKPTSRSPQPAMRR